MFFFGGGVGGGRSGVEFLILEAFPSRGFQQLLNHLTLANYRSTRAPWN